MRQKKRIITGICLLFGAIGFSLLSHSPLLAEENLDTSETENTSLEETDTTIDHISSESLPPENIEEASPPSPEALNSEKEDSGNKALEVLRDRQEKVQEVFQTSEIEKKKEQAKSELETLQLEKKAIEEINAEIQQELELLKSKIVDQDALQESLLNAEQKSDTIQQQLIELQSVRSTLEKEVENKNALLERNNQQLDSLSQEEQLKEYALEQNLRLQQALQEKSDAEIKQKLSIFFWITLVFGVLYGIRLFIARRFCISRKCRKRYAHRFVAFDILSFLAYLGFLVWFFFYLNPEMVVYLLFLLGAVVLVLQEYIFSIVSSIFIVQMYQVGARVRFDGGEGIIEGITLLKTSIRTIDMLGTNMQELRIISNSQIMKKEMTILPRKEIEKTSFRVILPNDLSINQAMFAKHIEEEVLQTNITVKSMNEITDTEYFYEMDFSFMGTGQPVIQIFWYETREKSNRIKRKILAELEKFKQASLLAQESLSADLSTDKQDDKKGEDGE